MIPPQQPRAHCVTQPQKKTDNIQIMTFISSRGEVARSNNLRKNLKERKEKEAKEKSPLRRCLSHNKQIRTHHRWRCRQQRRATRGTRWRRDCNKSGGSERAQRTPITTCWWGSTVSSAWDGCCALADRSLGWSCRCSCSCPVTCPATQHSPSPSTPHTGPVQIPK